MGTKRILVDATHHEQTRVALLDGNLMEDFEVEITAKKPLKGNIYLARISRIEPSLQAAFVEYGGNRHGFLPFSEIHPDYFLISDQERQEVNDFYNQKRTKSEETELETPPVLAENESGNDDDDDEETDAPLTYSRVKDADYDETKEFVASDNEAHMPPHRRFNIQDVLKRRQILLIQVTKEERGNKGAALTTYLSIAGRYCVLMPNTNHTGGVSRRIASVGDRRRLRDILNTLSVPDNMAVIIRTAGSQKSKLDIQRDYEYLLRVWNNIRARVFESFTPSLVYEEANLIKRTIRDMYSQEITEILISGEQGFDTAKELMSLLIPNRLNKLRKYEDSRVALFQRWNTEAAIESLLSVEAPLPSGGSLVINPTEALIAIDVNSGKATSEGSVEETALATNLEAATEVARQLRMRNLAGLVVIDFIDMEVGRHRTAVERKLKEALAKDRSRIQVGKISPFGLLELSRQRTSPSLIEAIAAPCSHCQGHGFKWSVEASGLHIVRSVESELMKSASSMIVHAADLPTLWILNEKRAWINQLEDRYNIRLSFISDNGLSNTGFRIDRIAAKPMEKEAQHITSGDAIPQEPVAAAPEAPEEQEAAQQPSKSRRRRNRRKPKYMEKRQNQAEEDTAQASNQGENTHAPQAAQTDGKASSNNNANNVEQGEVKSAQNNNNNNNGNNNNRRGNNNRQRQRGQQSKQQQGEARIIPIEAPSDGAKKIEEKPAQKPAEKPVEKTEEKSAETSTTKRPSRRSRNNNVQNKAKETETATKVAEEKPAEAAVKAAPKEIAKAEIKAENSEKPAERPKRQRNTTRSAKSSNSDVTPSAEEKPAAKSVKKTTKSSAKKVTTVETATTKPKTAAKKSGWWSKKD